MGNITQSKATVLYCILLYSYCSPQIQQRKYAQKEYMNVCTERCWELKLLLGLLPLKMTEMNEWIWSMIVQNTENEIGNMAPFTTEFEKVTRNVSNYGSTSTLFQ